ncbi:Alpha/Beta hydrolase protein [Gamsiella multidivaricata]|uniref:Alpha/Beta hydrolase protein n=1 Tax=Gamsiella multidivaricata TaxID=101098 RepID=UPI0022209904|nr:Alpha/Beta hydrolase protein [Gamsiella multidivaricata]KAG0355894.1 Bifunctional epoxide hydrolase 2 [Gamsiella multidivaricata]KAI7818663.1 Alpha/Beta hydrolase protein [Gamsiella multidivaricata]
MSNNTPTKLDAENPGLYGMLKITLANLTAIEAHHIAVSKPTAPENHVSSFNHKYATLNGYRYHYVEEGDPNNETLILVHGFPDLWYGWRYQIRHLVKQGYHVIAVDNLGVGETDHPRCDDGNYDPYRTKNIAANLVKLLDHLNVDKAVWIGHDWGSTSIWKVGLYYPERCRAIISIGFPHIQPVAQFVEPDVLAEHFPQFRFFSVFQTREPEGWFDGDAQKVAIAMFNSVYGAGVGTSHEEKQYYVQNYARTTLHGGLNYYRAVRLNHEDELPYIGKPYTVPALQAIIEKDPIVTPAFVAIHPSETMTSLEKVSIKEGGHNAHTENPEEVNKVIDAYLAKVFQKDK